MCVSLRDLYIITWAVANKNVEDRSKLEKLENNPKSFMPV